MLYPFMIAVLSLFPIKLPPLDSQKNIKNNPTYMLVCITSDCFGTCACKLLGRSMSSLCDSRLLVLTNHVLKLCWCVHFIYLCKKRFLSWAKAKVPLHKICTLIHMHIYSYSNEQSGSPVWCSSSIIADYDIMKSEWWRWARIELNKWRVYWDKSR